MLCSQKEDGSKAVSFELWAQIYSIELVILEKGFVHFAKIAKNNSSNKQQPQHMQTTNLPVAFSNPIIIEFMKDVLSEFWDEYLFARLSKYL